MGTKYYEYAGQLYTIPQLAAISDNIPIKVLRRRIYNGWSVDTALHTPINETSLDVPPEWKGKNLEVIFREPVPNVFARMQPELNRPYVAELPEKRYTYEKGRPHYLIYLREGLPLIVYPGEFQILAEAKQEAGKKGTA